MTGISRVTFQSHGDSRGELIALEGEREIPFPIKRVYYIYGTEDGVRRGHHAHKQLEQMLICLHGSCKIYIDDGDRQETVPLDDPSQGLYLGPGLWHEMYDFSPGAVLMVLASALYDEEDYIRDYEAFLRYRAACNIADK